MVRAATAFVMSIMDEPAKVTRARLPMGRIRQFKYTPGTRDGLALGMMNEQQRMRALALVQAGLSQSGYTKAQSIRALEVVLDATGQGANRDPGLYYLVIFGDPAVEGDWGWRWEGHHLSLHYTLSKCASIADTPAFFGANPARVPAGINAQGAPPAGTRVLAREEDLARELATMLNADLTKRALALIGAVGGTANDVPDEAPTPRRRSPAGLPASAMNMAESQKLKELVMEYAAAMPAELAAARLKRIQDAGGFDMATFLWRGPLANGAHAYHIQGPTFLIQYYNTDGGNHIHSAWRDFNGDFGEDLLMLHLKEYPH